MDAFYHIRFIRVLPKPRNLTEIYFYRYAFAVELGAT